MALSRSKVVQTRMRAYPEPWLNASQCPSSLLCAVLKKHVPVVLPFGVDADMVSFAEDEAFSFTFFPCRMIHTRPTPSTKKNFECLHRLCEAQRGQDPDLHSTLPLSPSEYPSK